MTDSSANDRPGRAGLRIGLLCLFPSFTVGAQPNIPKGVTGTLYFARTHADCDSPKRAPFPGVAVFANRISSSETYTETTGNDGTFMFHGLKHDDTWYFTALVSNGKSVKLVPFASKDEPPQNLKVSVSQSNNCMPLNFEKPVSWGRA